MVSDVRALRFTMGVKRWWEREVLCVPEGAGGEADRESGSEADVGLRPDR